MDLCCSINIVVLVSKSGFEVISVKCVQRNTTVATRILMAYLGTIAEFSSSQESWTAYVERLVQYLAVNKIEDADQQ